MSKEIPYSPMHKPRRVSVERMNEILAKHTTRIAESRTSEGKSGTEAKADEGSSQVVENNSPPPLARMKWKSRTYTNREGETVTDANVIESDGGYRVLRCTSDGVPTGRFLAFHVLIDKRTNLGGYESGEEARTACEAHRAKASEAAAA